MPGKPGLVAFSALLLAGCAATRVERVTLEPVVIQASPGGGTVVSSPGPELEELAALQEAGKCDLAKPRLERFLELFPESERFAEATLRLGLCEEALGELERARSYYRYVAARGPGDLGREGALRAAWSLEKLGRPEDAASDYRRIAGLPGLPEDLVAGAHLRRAVCLFRAGHGSRARRELSLGARLRRECSSPPASLATAEAEARFAQAENALAAFRAVRLEYPQGRLRRRMASKLTALSQARAAFDEVVAVKDPDWAAAAVYRKGEMMEEMYRDLVELPPPPSLSPAEQAEYGARVKEEAKPLQQQAFEAYQQVLALGERVGLASDWVEKSRQRARELEPLLKAQVLTPDVP